MNNYYPLSRVTKKLTNELIVATPTEKRGWSYFIADDNWDWLRVDANLQYRITNVSFTHKYKGLGMALKRAKTKQNKICRYAAIASWNEKVEKNN